MSSIEIKRLDEDAALDEAYILMNVLRPTVDKAVFKQQLQQQWQENYRLLGLYADAQLVALTGYRIVHKLSWGKHLYIDDLVTAPTQLRKGYARRLFEHLLTIAREQNCQELHLDSGVQRFAAHALYLRMGMRISSHHFSLSLRPDDASGQL